MKLAVRDLSPASPIAMPLPDLDSDIRADFESGGRATFSIPLRLDYGTRIAEMAVKGAVSTDARGALFDASLEGSLVSGDDIAGLVLLFRGGGPAMPPLPGRGPNGAEAVLAGSARQIRAQV